VNTRQGVDSRAARIQAAIASYCRKHGRLPPIDRASRFKRRIRRRRVSGRKPVGEIIRPLFDQLAGRGQR